MKILVTKIDLNNKVYGGRVYENQVIDLLKEEFVFKREFLMKYKFKLLNIPWMLYLFIKYKFFYKETLFLSNQTTWFAGRRSHNIVVIHHLDSSCSNGLSSLYQRFCERALYRNREKFARIVTVAECWKKQLEKDGFHNVAVIYNSFDVNLYTFTEKDKKKFRMKYGFIDKPLIYLGNCQKKKGVVEAYNTLRNIDAYFVTSGTKDVDLPIPNLQLSYSEYRLLLASSDIVITMSLFKEGWNRTAHEAILCGIPVIGSGSGGMKELLDASGQIVCNSFDDLLAIVDKLLKYPVLIKGDFVHSCNLEYFKKEWTKVLSESNKL